MLHRQYQQQVQDVVNLKAIAALSEQVGWAPMTHICKRSLKSLPLTPHNLAVTTQTLFANLAPAEPQDQVYEETPWRAEAQHGLDNPHPDWHHIMHGVRNHDFHRRAEQRSPGYAQPVGSNPAYPGHSGDATLVVTGSRDEMLALQAKLRAEGHEATF